MTGPLWTRDDLVGATGGEAIGDWAGVSGVSIDTRELASGDLFIALKGISHDGHVHVAKALETGAAAALVSHRPEDVAEDAPLLMVGDTLSALEQLGHAGRARTGARVIAVTGSVGKTSTKEMLRTMLAGQGRTHAATRSFNNHWGVPLTLARMPADTKYAVLEIGMNHPGEIVPLSRMAKPHVGLITTVEAVHMAAFNSVEEIADAKAEIFAGLGPGGVAVLNADNAHFGRLYCAAGLLKVVTFGAAAGNFVLKDVVIEGEETCITTEIDGAPVQVTIPVAGAHFALNALGALASVRAVGGDVGTAIEALAGWQPPQGRGSRVSIDVEGGHVTLLDESYNANPASMRAAIAVLASAKGRRVAFLGDMLELGPQEFEFHAGLADLPEIGQIDTIHTCGPLMKHLHDALPVQKRGLHCADSEKLGEKIAETVDAGDVCMVKGSLGARMARVVAAIKDLGTTSPDSPDGDR